MQPFQDVPRQGQNVPFQELCENAGHASTLLKAIGNERRLRILCHLSRGEHAVGELEPLVGLSQSALSQHLARLREDGLVATRRCAQTVFYGLKGDAAVTVMKALESLFEDGYGPEPVPESGGRRSPVDRPVDRTDGRELLAGTAMDRTP